MKTPTEIFIEQATMIHKGKYDYSKIVFNKSTDKITIICKEHGEFIQQANSHKSTGRGCPTCAKELRRVKKTKTIKEFVNEANKLHSNRYTYGKSKYVDAHSELIVTCKKHGDFHITPSGHLKGRGGCKECGKDFIRASRLQTKRDFIKAFFKTGNKYIFIPKASVYLGDKKPIEVKCRKCKRLFNAKPHNLKNGTGCIKCKNLAKGVVRRLGIKIIQSRLDKMYGRRVLEILPTEITPSKYTPIRILCKGCDKVFTTNPDNILRRDYKCPTCFPRYVDTVSKGELQVADFIKSVYNGEVVQSDRAFLSGKELDITIPNLNFAVEYNGNYWHSIPIKERSYHRTKSELAKEVGIHLFHIWEDQWSNVQKQLIWKSILKQKLQVTSNSIYARKTTVVKLGKTPTEFLNKHHLQGAVTASYSYALMYEDKIVSVMTFSAIVNGVSELTRFVSKRGLRVQGGFSKLLSAFRKEFPDVDITSFSANDYSDGGVYRNNGFLELNKLPEDYFYVHQVGSSFIRYHKFSMRKKKLISKFGLPEDYHSKYTEKQLAEKVGLLTCYDSGKIKWIRYANKQLPTDI